MQFPIDENCALLVIDPQVDFADGGALAVPGGSEIVPVANKLMRLFKHVVLSKDWHPANHKSFASQHPGAQPFDTVQLSYGDQVAWPDHCVEGTVGADLIPDLDASNVSHIVLKGTNPEIDSYSAFFENDQKTSTGLDQWLQERGITRVYLLGLARNYCVGFSALDAVKCGFEAVVVEDGCRAIPDGSDAAMTQAFRDAGVISITSDDLA